MKIKKICRKIFGAELTASEKKAMDLEIQKQLAEYDRKHVMEIDSMILWVLYDKFDFEVDKLREFHDSFGASLNDLLSRYELEEEDQIWLCTRKLKDIGVDLEEWNMSVDK